VIILSLTFIFDEEDEELDATLFVAELSKANMTRESLSFCSRVLRDGESKITMFDVSMIRYRAGDVTKDSVACFAVFNATGEVQLDKFGREGGE